jgi:glycosyltransferase involved in cell wall biosynthesis
VIHSEARTIAGVRNAGVEVARGKVLVFLDADIVVQKGWGNMLRSEYTCMMKNGNLITGSHPQVPENIRPILRSWYKGLSMDPRNTHLGTGHLIVTRSTFDMIGRFDETLETNEDFYFCQEAIKKGIKIVINPDLKVLHYGFPNSLVDFAKREIWHGIGDCKTLKCWLRSRVACLGTVFFILHILMLLSLFLNFPLLVINLPVIVFIIIFYTIYMFDFINIRNFIYRCVVAYIYFFCRGLSLAAYIFSRNKAYYWKQKSK